MADFITVTDHGGKKINVNVDQITHFYDHNIWVSGSVTVECKELGGQIAMMIGKAKSPTKGGSAAAGEAKGPFDSIVKDHLAIENP